MATERQWLAPEEEKESVAEGPARGVASAPNMINTRPSKMPPHRIAVLTAFDSRQPETVEVKDTKTEQTHNTTSQ
jgi:hypothetical protein